MVQEIEAALALLRRAIREDCPVRFESEVPEAYVYMSPVDFQQAIVNLCNNAADAMPQGGTITLRCRLLKDAGDQVEVTIEDEGEGMTPERLARATELFFTTKPPGRGTGLG
ncbi:MAG TPA: hypothetical protein DEA08_34320, partial [Planctomycetes bacterium]|nr:hypothetical protein [Planctomycetota bacterium]